MGQLVTKVSAPETEPQTWRIAPYVPGNQRSNVVLGCPRDLAVLRAHLDEQFPRFAYHDGVFESLDDRKKENLLAVISRYTALGIQSIITLIDSDLPQRTTDEPVFAPEDIVLQLHDEGDRGRLFKMKAW